MEVHIQMTLYIHLSQLWQAYQLAEQWCLGPVEGARRWPTNSPPLNRPGPREEAGKPEPMPYKKTALRLHSGLPRAHGSLLTQIRTGKDWPRRLPAQVPGPRLRVPGLRLRMAVGHSTACHTVVDCVMVDCPRFSRERMQLRQAVCLYRYVCTDFRWLTSDPRAAAAALTTSFLWLNLLPQFTWAQEQLSPPPPPPPPPPCLTAPQSLFLFYSILSMVGGR